jgi:maltose alpha-D-glucosyltransferase/alpha-amylase
MLDRLVDEQRLMPNEAVAETSEISAMLQWMRQIGRRTAELHLAFATPTDDAAFTPEPISADDTARWTEALLGRAHNVFGLIESNVTKLPEATAALAKRLLEHRSAAVAHIEATRNSKYNGLKTRHHGDFHLGQILIAKDDAYILDFEGEPRRSLDDRRRKAPPARDVAGFIRSIDYAISAAMDRGPNLSAEDRAALVKQIRIWGDRLTAAYWESYQATLGDAPLWPTDEVELRQLLDLFLLEKAFYEIEYEMTNRPSWVHIPLEATLRILEQRGVIV